ncbi:MAG: response regulator [Anaerolineae bacterium]|jgi:DNA-binding response OmpR family regulator
MTKGKVILVAEDEVDIRKLIVYSLRFVGYQVIEALDGLEALHKAIEEKPDLILLDVRMPKMNGYEACTALKQEKSTQDIPVVFLSARGQDTEIQHGLSLGAEEYILKPFEHDELYRRVGAVLDRVE